MRFIRVTSCVFGVVVQHLASSDCGWTGRYKLRAGLRRNFRTLLAAAVNIHLMRTIYQPDIIAVWLMN